METSTRAASTSIWLRCSAAAAVTAQACTPPLGEPLGRALPIQTTTLEDW